MARCPFILLGPCIVLLTHVHSLVLLTANFEDIKKIAQRFVSNSVAENIADFIAKATEDIVTDNISEENEATYNKKASTKESEQDSSQSASDDSKYMPDIKILPKKKSTEQRSVEDLDNRDDKYKFNNKLKQKRFKSKSKEKQAKKSKSLNVDRQKKKKDTRLLEPIRKPKTKTIWGSREESDLSENDSASNTSKLFTAGYMEESLSTKDPVKNKKSAKKGTYDYYNKYLKESQKYTNREVKKRPSNKFYKVDRSATLTTRVERNEFDQYDNRNYPKAELVATSGSMTLTKVFGDMRSGYRDEWT